MVMSTLIGVISIVTLIITLVTKSHDPLSRDRRIPQIRVPLDLDARITELRKGTS